MKKLAFATLFGGLTILMTGCAVSPPTVAVTPPRVSFPGVVVVRDVDRPVYVNNYEHDRRDFGRSHNQKRWNNDKKRGWVDYRHDHGNR